MGVQVWMQTNFTDPMMVHDTDAPASPDSKWKALAMDVLKPVVQVRLDSGTTLYKSGEFYEAQGKYFLWGFAAVAIVGIAAIMAKITSAPKK
jgi:hypothetical protein